LANSAIYNKDVAGHPGRNHYDVLEGTLIVNKFQNFIGSTLINSGIKDWDLIVSADHKVPEPTTMLGSALALGWGGWVKRKNSIKHNKTTSQG
jgi:hypothetical protein